MITEAHSQLAELMSSKIMTEVFEDTLENNLMWNHEKEISRETCMFYQNIYDT